MYSFDYRAFLGALSVAIGALAYAIYLYQTVKKGSVEPHPFSWFLWALTTLVAYLVQRAGGGGAGSWVNLFTALSCFVIWLAALMKYRSHFTTFDLFCLIAGILVFVGWAFMRVRSPGISAVLATLADVAGYGPTIRKGWAEPHRDSATSFFLNGLKFLVSLLALQSWTLVTWLFPTTLLSFNLAVTGMLRMRRLALRQSP